MDSLPIKSALIQLVEKTDQEPVLRAVLAFFKDVLERQGSPAWESLSELERQEVLDAYLESENETQLISLEKAFEKLK
jgi:hypothetical protein